MSLRPFALLAAATVLAAGCRAVDARSAAPPWRLAADSPVRVEDAALVRQIGLALDAAATSGTDPSISGHHVKAATAVTVNGRDEVVVGGNTEYALPEAIHGEVSVMNHVTARFGHDLARKQVRFIAFYSDTCSGDSRGCGDCRDYFRRASDTDRLLWICGQGSDRTFRARRFADGLAAEESFRDVTPSTSGLPEPDLARLVEAATGARAGGVSLFTPEADHVGAAALTFGGRLYRAAGADDAAFHYRFPIGGVLQQAATERDYFVRAIVVAGSGAWPRITYRDRQYGFEASSMNQARGRAPIVVVLADGNGRLKATTFEEALPKPFSVARFNPGAIEAFLKARADSR